MRVIQYYHASMMIFSLNHSLSTLSLSLSLILTHTRTLSHSLFLSPALLLSISFILSISGLFVPLFLTLTPPTFTIGGRFINCTPRRPSRKLYDCRRMDRDSAWPPKFITTVHTCAELGTALMFIIVMARRRRRICTMYNVAASTRVSHINYRAAATDAGRRPRPTRTGSKRSGLYYTPDGIRQLNQRRAWRAMVPVSRRACNSSSSSQEPNICTGSTRFRPSRPFLAYFTTPFPTARLTLEMKAIGLWTTTPCLHALREELLYKLRGYIIYTYTVIVQSLFLSSSRELRRGRR